MKALNILVATLFLASTASQASADEQFTLDNGSIALSAMKASSHDYEVQTLYPKCRPSARCLPYKVIDLEMIFTLGGCVDQLGPVSIEHAYNREAATVDIFVSALNVHNEKSQRVRCFVAPTEKVNRKVLVGGARYPVEKVNIHYMGTDRSTVTR